MVTTFLLISSSRAAQDSAERSTVRRSLTVRREGTRRQHLPTAQQRRVFSGRRASLPWAQHWQVVRTLLSQVCTSRTVNLSRRLVPRPGTM